MSTAVSAIAVAYAVVRDTDGKYRVATTANRTSYGRARGIAITAASTANPSFEYQVAGVLSESVSGVGTGTAGDWVRVTSAGALERTATVSSGDDVVGRCPTTTAEVQVNPGVWDSDNASGGGGGGFTAPTGTGVMTVTSGSMDAASTGTTGTGDFARATSPTFVTPTLGAASATSVAASSFVSVGASAAATGGLRFAQDGQWYVRDEAGSADIRVFTKSNLDVLYFGQANYSFTIDAGTGTFTLLSNSHNFMSGNGATSYATISSSGLVLSNGPSITVGTGAPASSPSNGSIYLRTDGSSSTGLYTRQGGAWSAVGAGSSAAGSTADEIQTTDGAGAFQAATNVKAGSGYISIGSGTVATTGTGIRLGGTAATNRIVWHDGTADRSLLTTETGGNGVIFGSQSHTCNYYGSSIVVYSAAGATFIYGASAERLRVEGNGVSLGGGAGSYGSGNKVVFLANATTVPTTNPTGGSIIYAEAGAAKSRGTSGTITTFGPADPHCPTCGRDFAVEHRNDDAGEHLALCLPCLVDALAARGVDTSRFTIADSRGASKERWLEIHAAGKARAAAEP
jgi:hypothetical protein